MPSFPLKLMDVSLSHYILWDSCMLMCTRGWGQKQLLGLPGRHRTRTPFSVGSQRHELGRLDIQETNKAPSQTGIRNQQQPNAQLCRESSQKEKVEKNKKLFKL